MQEFRPPSVIAADTALAERLHVGDADAVRALVERYGTEVTAVVAPVVGRDHADDVACDVFVRACREPITPGDEFAPWLAGIVENLVGPVDEQRWAVATATSSIAPDVRDRLREHHLARTGELADDLGRHELRLRRRLSHVGDTDEVLAALSDPTVWTEADPNLAERVFLRIANDADDPNEIGTAVRGDAEVDHGDPDDRSTLGRLLRPILLGIGGGLAVLFVAIIALSAASGTPQQPNFTAELTPTGAIVEVEDGEITVTQLDAGIEIEVDAATLPRRAAGAFYEGRLTLADGNELSAGTFSEGADVTLWVGALLDDAVSFEIVARDLDTAVDSGEVVLKADIPPS